jgi:hypothetical protein
MGRFDGYSGPMATNFYANWAKQLEAFEGLEQVLTQNKPIIDVWREFYPPMGALYDGMVAAAPAALEAARKLKKRLARFDNDHDGKALASGIDEDFWPMRRFNLLKAAYERESQMAKQMFPEFIPQDEASARHSSGSGS